ncbi:SRPBCC domain-containing protein [Planomicrobium sp. CPCC 101079]|uniref:SRPBCC domain-containing protein n=1 Tax=Planomicrobium sp. CPCC 101079 TaxID=2599618 RepID=UPI0011B35799|nr:SRPBCC domain-containing protein [Planomicrobium sp. CPCC 101079]TWT01534.1 ATPase [Planomicrobium sp. CPCC 101079]
MTNPSSNRIDSTSRVIEATPKAIYQAFMNPEDLAVWLPPEGMSAHVDVFEPHEGGTYKITLTYETDEVHLGKTSENTDVTQGRFLELVPDTKIVLAGQFDSEDEAFSGEMVQTWYLEAVEEGTKVTIICENVPTGIRKEDHDEGMNSTLENLANFMGQ